MPYRILAKLGVKRTLVVASAAILLVFTVLSAILLESLVPSRAVLLPLMGVMLLCGLSLVATLYLLVSRVVLQPLDAMSGVARRVSDCDLTARAEKRSEDELGNLADSLNRIGESLAATLSRVQNVTGGVGTIIDRISRTGATVSSGVGTVSARVLDTSASMGQMIASLKGIADNVEVLAQSAEESSSSILEMAATNDEVAENIQGLAASVEETTAAIEEMTYSIKEVAKNIEELSATTEETSSSMNEMDVSISQVESNANETAKLSEQAQRDAGMGAEALSRTLGRDRQDQGILTRRGQRHRGVGKEDRCHRQHPQCHRRRGGADEPPRAQCGHPGRPVWRARQGLRGGG